MQLKLRLVDRAESSEWVRNNLGVWTRERLFQVGAEGEWKSMLCPAASFFEHAMTNWIRNEPNAESIMLGLRISALMDLLRIISYADLSPFKRLWAAIDCGFLIEELEQMQ
ncbi:hypothetical protein [Verrucomicrobium spinosum]|nr:hypothetical protein [Verrucomicrobium spinosum]